MFCVLDITKNTRHDADGRREPSGGCVERERGFIAARSYARRVPHTTRGSCERRLTFVHAVVRGWARQCRREERALAS